MRTSFADAELPLALKNRNNSYTLRVDFQEGSEENAFTVVDGILLSYNGSESTIVIPDNVNIIGERVFENNTYIREVTIPEGVVSIEKEAFRNCSSLERIIIPISVTFIDDNAFQNSNVTIYVNNPYCYAADWAEKKGYQVEVYNWIPFDANPTIGWNGFNGTISITGEIVVNQELVSEHFSGLEEETTGIHLDNVPKIDKNAFAEFYNIEGIYNIGYLQFIGEGAFRNCSKIYSINLESPIYIGPNAFSKNTIINAYEGSYIANWAIENMYKYHRNGDDRFTIIDGTLYSDTADISEINIPENVYRIGPNSYSGRKLSKLTIPDAVEIIDESAFQNCSGLSSVNFVNGLRIIGQSAFENCGSLETIILPDSITEIRAFAFHNTGLDEIYLPNSLTSIDYSSFDEDTVIYAKRNSYAAEWAIQNNFALQLIPDQCADGTIILPSELKEISDSAFKGTVSVNDVILPDGMTTIGKKSFAYNFCLRHIYIPDSVESIGECAFTNDFDIIFYCQSDNYGASYARDHNIPFVIKP